MIKIFVFVWIVVMLVLTAVCEKKKKTGAPSLPYTITTLTPQQFGASPDDSLDDRAGIQAALDSAQRGGQHYRVEMNCGFWVLCGPLIVCNREQLVIDKSCGRWACRVQPCKPF